MAVLEEIYNDRYVVGELMDFPGFRFYPTEEELVGFYLKKQVQGGHLLNLDIVIPTLDLYRYDPWELPGLANDAAERQWFFFVPRQSKNSCPRPNRLTMSGFWKATGTDRAVRNKQLQCIGLKKTLVFYKGKAPGGQRTDWIMNEYRLPDFNSSRIKNKIDIVLCRIYRKAASRKSMEERTKPNHVEESAGDKYEEKLSHSFAVNGRGQLSNPVRKTELCSLHYQNQERVCSFDLFKTNVEENLVECLEPITEASCRAPDLELSTFMVELFSHEPTTSSWEDTGNAWSPHALLSTP